MSAPQLLTIMNPLIYADNNLVTHPAPRFHQKALDVLLGHYRCNQLQFNHANKTVIADYRVDKPHSKTRRLLMKPRPLQRVSNPHYRRPGSQLNQTVTHTFNAKLKAQDQLESPTTITTQTRYNIDVTIRISLVITECSVNSEVIFNNNCTTSKTPLV